MSGQVYAYLGIKDGQVVAATVDLPEQRAATSKEVAKWMRKGCHIERVTVETARVALFEPWPLERAP